MTRTITLTMEPQFDGGEFTGTACISVDVHGDTFSEREFEAAVKAAKNAPQIDPVEWPGLGRIRVVSRKAVKDASRGTPSLITITIAE